MQYFLYIHDAHLTVRDDYPEQVTSDILALSFRINGRYILIDEQRMPDVSSYMYSMYDIIVF